MGSLFTKNILPMSILITLMTHSKSTKNIERYDILLNSLSCRFAQFAIADILRHVESYNLYLIIPF